MKSDWETFGPLLHGTARVWRQKLDERLKPMGLSQAKWRTLLHLSLAQDALTQAEIAARLGVEEPSVVTLLHRLEREGWVTRRNSPHDRRCNMVLLGRRAQRVIAQINATADELRYELLTGIAKADLQTCIKVLARIREKAEKNDKPQRSEALSVYPTHNGQNRTRHPNPGKKALHGAATNAK
ncbi:MAG TPA: MarR family transcriptional regulator [Candidatus Baltobacteraceae bacterium]|jgi:MarR family transcriptional regulator for hemolysin|nr:MarR family transcriptional regulator [Candidatus Baltobacteraceae bacterium]